ncbi:uncharacterized protein LOC116266318 [Nymphaea colorata]|nr:uncharacterized protein LOC116266318 [Nymphaea colorata]
MKKKKSAAQKQNTSHGPVGETSQHGSEAKPVAPIEDDAMVKARMFADEIGEIADILEVQLISSDILEKLRKADSRRSHHPLPESWQSKLNSLRAEAAANLSKILHLLQEEHDSDSAENSEKLAPGAMQQRGQTTPKEEDPPHPGQLPLHFHIYASALLPEPYVAQGWHYVPVLQHGAPPPARGNQSVPVQEHGEPTAAGGYQSVLVHHHGNAIHHMPMPYVPSPYRPGYLQHNQRIESSESPHGNDERQQDSRANNPSHNNSLQDGVPENNLGARQCT